MPDPQNHPRFGCRHPLGEHSIGLPHVTKLTLACKEAKRKLGHGPKPFWWRAPGCGFLDLASSTRGR
jgi:hypothetical protein